LENLKVVLMLSSQRLASNPGARDMLAAARTDPRFNSIRALPEFQKLIPPK